MCLHLVGLITIYILPRLLRGGERPSAENVSVPVSNGTNHSISSASVTKLNGAQANGVNSHQRTKIVQSNNAHNNEQFVDDVPNCKQCDINVNMDNKLEVDIGCDENVPSNSVSNDSAEAACRSNSSTSNSSSCNLRNETHDYRRQTSTDNQHLSMKIRERIDSETRYIEEFIDKTVTGIVELKDDLMRVNQDEMYSKKLDCGNGVADGSDDGMRKRNLPDLTNGKEIETFLRKEINMAVNQVNVLPAVLSNGHAD